jgi:hypothetical protein
MDTPTNTVKLPVEVVLLRILLLANVIALVGVPSVQVPSLMRVAPGDAESSYLLHKLRGTHVSVGGSGNAMPPYLVLADTELAQFSAWIDAGAER